MADEFRHVTVGGRYSRTEFEARGRHLFDSQAKGDTMFASSTTQLSRRGIGSTNQLWIVTGGVPVWSSTITGISLTSCEFGTSTLTANSANRGKFYFTEGAGGVADKLYCIMKGTDDNYSAVQVAIG